MTTARPTMSLRPAAEADRPFLRSLYAETHGSDFDQADLSAEGQEILVDHQFAIRERAYAAYPGIRSSIILLDGRPAGRLLVSDDGDQLQLVDIAVLGVHRGRGIGTALLSALAEEADARGLPIGLQVDHGNPARNLYERLGFTACGAIPFRVVMRREPLDPRDEHPSPSAPLTRSTS